MVLNHISLGISAYSTVLRSSVVGGFHNSMLLMDISHGSIGSAFSPPFSSTSGPAEKSSRGDEHFAPMCEVKMIANPFTSYVTTEVEITSEVNRMGEYRKDSYTTQRMRFQAMGSNRIPLPLGRGCGDLCLHQFKVFIQVNLPL